MVVLRGLVCACVGAHRLDPAAISAHLETARASLAAAGRHRAVKAAAEDDDEAAFAAKERKRQAKDTARLAPTVLGGESPCIAHSRA